ncbi:hypothetical protein EUY23_24440 [Salmonella enterica]|nr:hypothetical protein [Salmonella enterica]
MNATQGRRLRTRKTFPWPKANVSCNQTLELWNNLNITFCTTVRIFPDKTGMVADEHVLFHAELKSEKRKIRTSQAGAA